MSTLIRDEQLAPGFRQAWRTVGGPVLLVLLPVVFAFLVVTIGYATYMPLGFDFRGTLWDPARAVLDGAPVYPEPTRAAVVVGNPAVYPPLFVFAAVPLALLPFTAAAWAWSLLLALSVLASLWVVGVRDWRCYVLAATSPPVLHGLFYGNLTLLLTVPLALAWRCRDRAPLVGTAVGVAIAGKLFLWPLLAWLLLTRRFRAFVSALAATAALVVGAWSIIGFQGLRSYPALLRVVQDVYGVRSTSLATVAGGFGASGTAAVAIAATAGIALLTKAVLLVRRADGDRRAFTLIIAASIIATPVVWPNYAALLLVPIAITWPRLGAAWFFGYLIWLAGVLVPPVKVEPGTCCKPDGVPNLVWGWSHQVPTPWLALGVTAVVLGITLAAARTERFETSWRR